MSAAGVVLAGKDWFTEAEAAEYCGLSLAKFRDEYPRLSIRPRRFGGRKLYSRADLYQAIAEAPEWQPSTNAATLGISTGASMASSADKPWARLSNVPLRKYVPRKKPS